MKEKLVRAHGLQMLRFRWDDLISPELVRTRLKALNIPTSTKESP